MLLFLNQLICSMEHSSLNRDLQLFQDEWQKGIYDVRLVDTIIEKLYQREISWSFSPKQQEEPFDNSSDSQINVQNMQNRQQSIPETTVSKTPIKSLYVARKKKSTTEHSSCDKHPFGKKIKGESYYYCYFCEQKVSTRSRHFIQHHLDDIKKWLTDNKKTGSLVHEKYSGFMRYIVPETTCDLFECESCYYLCMSFNTIKMHVENAHAIKQ